MPYRALVALSPIPKKARRPRKADAQAVADARKWKAEGMSVKKIAGYLEVSRATVYRYLQDA